MTPRTLGQLADYNRKHMSESHYSDKVQQMANERKQLSQYCGVVPEGAELRPKESFKEPWWRKGTPSDEKINKMTIEQKKTYIESGKVPASL